MTRHLSITLPRPMMLARTRIMWVYGSEKPLKKWKIYGDYIKRSSNMSLLKKIKLKSETVLGAMLIKVSLLLQWPALTALVFAAMTRDINHAGEYTVLCMRRSIFMDDVRAMARFSGRIRYLVVGRELVMQILT